MRTDVHTRAEPDPSKADPHSTLARGTPTDSPLPAADIFAGLTDPQRRAVTYTEGPLLVLAGPGSGKTRVITRRIAYLISCGIPAWQILALTFTNKAAAEMRQRVGALLGEGAIARGLTVSTFHALCARLLRRFADGADIPGLTSSFAIYDGADQLALVKAVLAQLNLSTANFQPRSVVARISAAKNELLDAPAFAARAGNFYDRHIARVFTAYEHALRTACAVDFDDLLLLTARMLRHTAAARNACRDRWQYLLIDEYQDTNHAQLVIASLLAGAPDGSPAPPDGPNLCVVGDPDQSIYGWRGADIGNILEFEEQYPKATVIPLGENFRSGAHILAAADALIRHNALRKHKDLYTSRPPGERVEVVLCNDEHDEARLVLDWFRTLQEDGATAPGAPDRISWKDMTVFYRTNALSRVIEDTLRNAGVPYVIARGTAFYEREEIRHALGYLRLVANPADDVSLGRIVNTPARGIGAATIGRVETAAAELGVPLLEALRRTALDHAGGPTPDLAVRTRAAIARFVRMIDGWTGRGAFMGHDGTGSLAGLVERVIGESGLEAMYRAGKTDADAERVENLAELVSSAREFEVAFDPSADPASDGAPGSAADPATPRPPLAALLRAFLEHVTLVSDADSIDPAQGAVTLMTLHAAKGLEFRAVAMVGLEEGLLPHSRASESPADLEEERRLCFVGITRAMERLVITTARYRTIRGLSTRTIPSRFLRELPPDHITVSDQAGIADSEDWSDDDRAQGGPTRSGAGSARESGRLSGSGLGTGSLVRHAQFGVGRVLTVTRGRDARARILFRDAGEKTIVLEYAKLERLDR